MSFISNKIEVGESGVCEGRGVFAKEDIQYGEIIVDIEARIVRGPSEYALQIGEEEFLLENYIDNLINHSCVPNCRVNLWKENKKRVSFISLKTIKKGEEIFWNYNSTEWVQNPEFSCGCKKKDCVGQIKGAKFLTEEQFEKIREVCSDFVRLKYLKLRQLE